MLNAIIKYYFGTVDGQINAHIVYVSL